MPLTTSDNIKTDGRGVLYESPEVRIIPVIDEAGNFTIEVRVYDGNGQQVHGYTRQAENSDLVGFEADIATIKDKLITACEELVLSDLEALNPSATITQT